MLVSLSLRNGHHQQRSPRLVHELRLQLGHHQSPQVSDILTILQAAPYHLRLSTLYFIALWEDLISRLKYSDGGATLTALKAYNFIHHQADNIASISALSQEYPTHELFDFLVEQPTAIDLFCAHLSALQNLC